MYADTNTLSLMILLGKTRSAIYARAKLLGLAKSKEYISELGRKACQHPKSIAARIKKGHTPFNKGKKEHEFRSMEAIEKCRATQFKAGNRPHNTRPIGYECVRKDGYVFIKVSDEMPMQPKHRVVWEQHHGAVPAGMCIAFRDGNRQNCAIENLMLIREAEKATRVTSRMTPAQIKERAGKAKATRDETIRKDRMRIRWGLEPKTKLIKKWHPAEQQS